MTTLTEIVAAVVVHSSAAAFSHFGLTLEPAHPDKAQPPAAHAVARTPARKAIKAMAFTVATPDDCPNPPHKA
jgi:hypothetical protein